MYVDGQRLQTLRGQGCGVPGSTPGGEDRRIRLAYDWPGSGGAPSVTVAQDIGTCDSSAPWQAAQSADEYAVTAVVNETVESVIHSEIRIVLPVTGMLDQGVFGLAVQSETQPGVVYRLPAFDAFPVLDDDVSSWESAYLGATALHVALPRHVIVDGNPTRIEEAP